MSGLFVIRTDHGDRAVLRPDGPKILLEILIRHPGCNREVPFVFGTRLAGESKGSLREACGMYGICSVSGSEAPRAAGVLLSREGGDAPALTGLNSAAARRPPRAPTRGNARPPAGTE